MGSSADEPTLVIFASFVASLDVEVSLWSVMALNVWMILIMCREGESRNSACQKNQKDANGYASSYSYAVFFPSKSIP
jgi:hypothetical protein